MKTSQTIPLLACGLCLSLAAPVVADDLPSADDVFAKYAEAIGADALAKVRNATMEFSFSMPAMGLETTGRFHIERPDKSYTSISLAAMGGADFEDGVNGDVAWQNNPQMGFRVLEGLERTMALQKTRMDSFAGWQERWQSAETVAEEAVDGRDCYKVELTSADDQVVTTYFDKETGLLLRQDIPAPQMGSSVVVTLSDYREVDGVKIARHIDQQGPMAVVIEFTEVRFNVDDIPEGTFELPEPIKDLLVQ